MVLNILCTFLLDHGSIFFAKLGETENAQQKSQIKFHKRTENRKAGASAQCD